MTESMTPNSAAPSRVGDRVDDRVQQCGRREPEQLDRALVGQLLSLGTADQLVEDAERVTHRSRAGPHDQGQHARLDGDAFGLAHRGEVVLEHARRHQAERVVVRPRPDGADDLLRLGGREDELHVRRRLFDHLQQGVEALRRDHVRLVDDVDLVARGRRREEGPVAQLAGVVDATVAGRVDLDDVDAARAAAREVAAALALTAGLRRRALLAVQAAREDARRGRLAAPTRAGEEVGVRDAVVRERLHERLGDVLLPDQVGEPLRAVAAVEGGRHGDDPSRSPGQQGTPRAPARARPTLAAFRPWGSSER